MVDRVRKEGGNVFVVDAGNLLWKSPTIAEGSLEPQRVKARLLADGYALAGVDAMAPGAGELALGLDFLKGLAEEKHLPYVAANLDCPGGAPFPASRVVEHGGITLGFVGVVGESVKHPGCRPTDPIPAVRDAIAKMSVDAVVLLSSESVESDERLVAEVPGIGLVVNGQDRKQLPTPKSLTNGGLLLASGSRGKQVGELAFTLTPGATAWRDDEVRGAVESKLERSRSRLEEMKDKAAKATDDAARQRVERQMAFFEKEVADATKDLADVEAHEKGPAHLARNLLVDLGPDVADHAETAALVAKAKVALGEAGGVTMSALATGTFAGSKACAGCHAAETAQWQGTAHAKAYASLQPDHHEMDPSCFACHVTGASNPAGPQVPGAVAGLEDVGCESCHGPGRAHVNDPKTPMAAAPDQAVCTTCHDGDRDGGRFDYATYAKKVVHE